MSQKQQKVIEENYACDAAKLLGEAWQLSQPSNEVPDFIINDGNSSFGLEITEAFKGDSNERGGSKSRSDEGACQALIEKYRT
jgi:hypothetical protein